MKKLTAIFFGLFLAVEIPVASQQVRFLRYGIKEGLSNETVNCLFKDSRGFLWAGTDFGLNRFDGVKFEKWFNIPGDTNSLLYSKINTITEDRQQRLWLGTDKGVSVYDTRSGGFFSLETIATETGIVKNLLQVKTFCDKDGDIWIGSGGGNIILLKQKTKRFYSIPVRLRPDERLQNEFVSDFLHDSKDRIWAGTSYGIYLLDKNLLTATPFRFNGSEPNEGILNACTRLFETHNQKILCGTWHGGFIIFNEQSKRFVAQKKTEGNFLPASVVFDFAQQDSLVYFASINGLYSCSQKDLLDPDFTAYKAYRSDPLNLQSVGSIELSSILSDTLGNIWMGGDKGISQLNAESKYYQSFAYGKLADQPEWPPSSVVQNGTQLYLAVGDNLISFDISDYSFHKGPVNISGKKRHEFLSGGGRYYLTSQTGLYIYNDRFALQQTIREQLPDRSPVNMLRVLRDRENNIWLGTSRYGIRKYDPKTGIVNKYLHDTSQAVNSVGYYIAAIIESSNGDIYAGSRQFFVFNREKNEFNLVQAVNNQQPLHDILTLKVAGSDIWIGSSEGLFNYDESTKTITSHRLPPHINQRIEEIETDNDGTLWLVTLSGLVKYNPADKSTMVFNKQNGWPGNFSLIKKLDDGRMLAGCDGRIILLNPADIKRQTYSPPPQITQLIIDENTFRFMPGSDTVFRIKYNQSIRFNFVSLTYNNAEGIKYEWQLKGLGKEWHPIGNQNTMAFSALAPGNYTFLIRSVNAGDVESNSYASIKFRILPPFYLTWWFITAGILMMVFIVYAFYRYRLKQAVAVEKMRTRISTDLHDDIGATLSSISFYSEAVRQKVKEKLPEAEPILEKMGETSRSMVGNMSDIVWAINPKNDAAESLFKRMHSYAAELCQLKNVQLQFDYDNLIDKRTLDIATRKNIYLIFKEAVNNALKYSACSFLKIKLETKDHDLRMSIFDNGKGFDLQLGSAGNGLTNMKRRAAELKGDFKINTSEFTGTTVELDCPLP